MVLCWFHPLLHKKQARHHSRRWYCCLFIQKLLLKVPFSVFIYWPNESINSKIDVWDSWSENLKTVKNKCFSSFIFGLPVFCFVLCSSLEGEPFPSGEELRNRPGNEIFQCCIQINTSFPSYLMQTSWLVSGIVSAPRTELNNKRGRSSEGFIQILLII